MCYDAGEEEGRELMRFFSDDDVDVIVDVKVIM
jgi:hypothetical protein